MGTKTIGIRDEVYERLRARKRDDESFTDVVDRLLEESTADWREGFGSLSRDAAEDLEAAATAARERTGAGLADRQVEALDALPGDDPDGERDDDRDGGRNGDETA